MTDGDRGRVIPPNVWVHIPELGCQVRVDSVTDTRVGFRHLPAQGGTVRDVATLRLPDDLHDHIRVLAKADRRSVSQFLAVLVEEALAARGQTLPAPAATIPGQTTIDDEATT